MITTHILVGGCLGLLSTFLSPGHVTTAILAGMVGGMVPDLDIFMEHRKTLHRPIQFTVLSILLLMLVMVQPSELTVVLAFTVSSMLLHSVFDIFSNGKTMRPEIETDDRAVYNHVKSEWIEPRRWVLDASRPDLIITLSAATALLFTSQLVLLTQTVMATGVVYFFTKKHVQRYLTGYARFSEFFQVLVGFGPETRRKRDMKNLLSTTQKRFRSLFP